MSDAKAALEPGWMNVLAAEFDKDYMVRLRAFLREEKQKGCLLYTSPSPRD